MEVVKILIRTWIERARDLNLCKIHYFLREDSHSCYVSPHNLMIQLNSLNTCTQRRDHGTVTFIINNNNLSISIVLKL